MRIGLLVYGSLETISGGNLYDRKLVEHLRGQGDQVEQVSLPWRNYPHHLGDNLILDWRRKLEGLSLDLLLQDELCHPSLAWSNRQIRASTGIPLISIVHHLRSSENHSAWILPFYRTVERAYLASVDGFIFNSQTTRRSVEQLLGRAGLRGVTALPAGDRFHGQVSAEEISCRARQAGPLEVLFVGNLIPRKNPDLLIRALARIDRSQWNLNIVGNDAIDPAYSRSMRRLAAKLGLQSQVHLLGVLGDAELARQFRRSHVLAVPSVYEGFGIVYLEGFQHGLPALASTRGAAGEIITPGETGWLVGPDQIEAAAACLDQAARERDRLAWMGRAASHRFHDFPTWEESMGSIRDYLAGWVR
jgi:glycosyltransferase involved in cell wall biosynthesis